MELSSVSLIIIVTTAAGICIPLGGLLACGERIQSQWLEQELRHFVIALGGGILLGTVSVVLIPEGIASFSQPLWSIPIIIAGGIAFFVIERWLGLRRRQYPQLIGMTLDYVPEAIALGGLIALGSTTAPLVAVLIGLQNLPEGFNAYRELTVNNSTKKTLLIMFMLVPLGPIAGLSGFFILAEHAVIIGTIMLFSSGGILYLLFQDIAPQSRLEQHWAPPLGAVIGFCVALFGHLVTLST